MTVAVEDLLLLEGTDRLLLEGTDRLLLHIVNPGDNRVLPRVNLLANTGPYSRFILPPYDRTRGT